MRRKDALECYEQTEAQDLIRLFQAMKPPEVQLSPAFRAKVLTRVEQRRARHGLLDGLAPLLTPWWAPVLAVMLLLSLSVNVRMGLQTFGQRTPASQRSAGPVPDPLGRERLLQAYTFQAGIHSATNLGTLVTAHAVADEPAVAFGFAATSERARLFRLGTRYAEALAYVHSSNLDAAAQRLAAMHEELVDAQGPSALSYYINEMQQVLQSQQYTAEVLEKFLALFEALYTEDARSVDTESLTLFRAGAWTENMKLAAAAGDKDALRQATTAQYFRREMQSLHAPQGVLDALEQIGHIVDKLKLTDMDAAEVLTLMKQVQQLFS
ncbi:MAG TPA: hypothetical protein VLQ80_30010 [Candidatus Saccharimonadia bacterium]|nr:hypothetical protein [Candidatus Saccharimonadia bacterium]